MSLYRTWRPLTFADLVGQDAVVRTLRSALAGGKLAHAYLFSGPRGSGKTSAAKILARCIDCVLGPTPDPDNTCENCRAILAGTALDVAEIDAASNRGIEEIRALRESVKFAPAAMRMKVFIIDEAHMLTREGANAFLKTLEEPPPHAVFVLATTAPEALPPTILSRCQRYAFRRIPVGVMVERMRAIAESENIRIDDEALGALAYRADGGLRDALTMLEQVAAYADGQIGVATVAAAFGATGGQYARRLVETILERDAAAALRTIGEASDAGADMSGLLRGAIAEYRNLLVARIDPALLASDLSASDAEAVTQRSRATAQTIIVRGLRLLSDALAAARSSGNARLEAETAVLRLVVQGEDPSLEALAARVALLEAGTESTSPATASKRDGLPMRDEREAPPSPRQREPAAGSTENFVVDQDDGEALPSLQQIRSSWERIRLRAEERYKPLRGILSQATVASLDGNRLTLGVVDALQESLMRERLPILEEAIRDVLRVPLRIAVRTRAGVATRPPQAASAHRANPHLPPQRPDPPGDPRDVDLMAYVKQKFGTAEGL